ncbi:LamG-like jellyroll fold domain-containing protein [Paenibacillus aestuarii]|uniref:LamG-like jellyroll fold domain-containing protein n=1 Tax=Paenibacillus aestuarii TaxID=516965 RepID=A0ABW0K245_9BACL|nr:LamG-like jellyroll fold domain-containing protein [Paenibacillus aestuarii]
MPTFSHIAKMGLFFLAMLLFVMPVPASAGTQGGYLVAYFRSDPSQTGEKIQKLHYGYSRDGVKWYELNKNAPVFTPKYALRDPFLNKGPDGIWRLVYTSPDVDATGKNTSTYYMGYAESTDLIHWTNEKRLDLMANYRPANTVYNVWAPEWMYNDETGKYIIYWSSTLNATGPTNNYHYKATTTDWNTFSDASLLFDPGVSSIDASMLRVDKNAEDDYYMFFKDESLSPMKMRQTWANEPVNKVEYDANISSNTITPDYTEAPEAFKLIGQNKWNLIYDYWSQGKYGLKSTVNVEDPTAWSAEISDARFPYKMRHASVATLTNAELWHVVNQFGVDAHYNLNSSANDVSGNGHNGTLNGSPAFTGTGGPEGGYINMDGVDDGIQLAVSGSTGFMHDAFATRSVSLWFKANQTVSEQVLFDEGGVTAGMSMKLQNNMLYAGAASGASKVQINTAFTDTASWHHAVVVFNEGKLLLYLDGALAASAATPYTSIDAHIDLAGLGKRYGQDAFGGTNGGAYFDGRIDQVNIYTVPLFPEDVQDLHDTP